MAVGITLAGFAGVVGAFPAIRAELRGIAYDELYRQKLTDRIVWQDRSLALLAQPPSRRRSLTLGRASGKLRPFGW